jgi:predicted GTPase
MTNNLDKTNRAYERYLSRQLRSHFGFAGVPLKLVWRKRESNRVPQS